MANAYRQMDFDEWEYLYPKFSLSVDQELNSPLQAMEEQQQALVSTQQNELEEKDDKASDEDSQRLSFEKEEDEEQEQEQQQRAEEEEVLGEMVEKNVPEIKEKDGCNAFSLRKWLRSAGLAAATVSIVMLQGGRGPKSMKKKHEPLQFQICTEDGVKHQQAVSGPLKARAHISLCGHSDERF